jgi:isopentenyldiphosphate isomerase
MAQEPGELFDLYTKEGTPLGAQKPRALVHRDGDWHRSLHVWVVIEGPLLLFQRRSLAKDTWPGAIDVAVTGHLRAGETVADGLREAREEIGLDLGPGDVIRLGLRRRADDHAPGILDRELQEIFLARTTLPLDAFRPDPTEVDGLIALPLDAAGALFRSELDAVSGMQLDASGAVANVPVVALADFVLPSDGYYRCAHRSIAAILAGQPEAAWEIG